jgi:hypothetical protein
LLLSRRRVGAERATLRVAALGGLSGAAPTLQVI